MPTIITADQLRVVLGVSETLYDDDYLDQIIDTAEGVILPLLETYSEAIVGVKRSNSIATAYFSNGHPFVVGQVVVVEGLHDHYNGNQTITVAEDNYIQWASAHPDESLRPVIPAGKATLQGSQDYVGDADVESAIYVVSVEVFQSRTAAGGQIEGVDFAPTPFRMGRSLWNRVSGLLGGKIDVGTIAQ